MTVTSQAGALRLPLRLTPVLVGKPWGGRRLERFGRALPDGELIGESWEVADLDPASTRSTSDPASRVASGALAGRTLRELIALDRSALLGEAPDLGGRFPLLVKLLDAREPLSVQVHPPAAYVRTHPDAHLKTESWVILDADPGAELMIGLADGVSRDDVANTLGSGALVSLLRRVPARPGDVHHLPAGIVHALGAGILVAEVQTPSDTTFRMYDWTEELGRARRELHVDAALRCVELAWEENVAPAAPRAAEGLAIDDEGYRLWHHRFEAGAVHTPAGGIVRIVQVLDGRVHVEGCDEPIEAGGVVVLPAAWSGSLHAASDSTVLDVTP